MRLLKIAKRRPFSTSAALIASVFTVSTMLVAGPAAAQYIYQPAPDYYHNDTASGTFLGGAMGAITGALVGGKHHGGQDALIGAGVGAVTGNILGRQKDATDERRAAVGAAAVSQLNQQAAAVAVTNYDLLQMTRAGISEDVIISTMRSRGARIDLSPQALIALKQQGVSDRVVIAAQQIAAAPGYYAPAGTTTVVSEVPPPPSTVIVEPGWRPYHYYYPRPYYYHQPRAYVRVGF
jgi:outer membrane lipoprotein SlyB